MEPPRLYLIIGKALVITWRRRSTFVHIYKRVPRVTSSNIKLISSLVFYQIQLTKSPCPFQVTQSLRVLKMRFTTALLSLLLPAVLVTAEVECQQNSGGPTDADARAAVDAFVAKYAPDGLYYPRGT
jgi:hypothetical protein